MGSTGMPCAMPLRPTSSKRASTCSPSNSCSDTATCVRPGTTSTSPVAAWSAPAVPSICSVYRRRADRRRPCRSSPFTGRRHRYELSSGRDHNPRKSRSPRSFENTVEHSVKSILRRLLSVPSCATSSAAAPQPSADTGNSVRAAVRVESYSAPVATVTVPNASPCPRRSGVMPSKPCSFPSPTSTSSSHCLTTSTP